jgi:hypothetical protein
LFAHTGVAAGPVGYLVRHKKGLRPMTEAEWLSATADVFEMRKTPSVQSNRRRFRLFNVACCRELDRWLTHPRVGRVLAAVERYADGKIGDQALGKWSQEAEQMRDTCDTRKEQTGWLPEWIAYHAVAYVSTSNKYFGWSVVADQILRHPEVFGKKFITELRRRFPVLLRDIFGNPFRPVTFSPDWRTDTTLSLARQMYESREFGALPILADALQDAGCDSAEILDHCRGSGPHVRGCWVVDLVLGKE